MKSIYTILGAVALCASLPSAASAYNGANQQCREFTQTIYIDGKPQEGVGTSCLQPDGTWRIVSEAGLPATTPNARNATVYRDNYYPASSRYGYGYGNYYPRSSISLSFGNSYKKRRYRGHDRYYSRSKRGYSRYSRSGHHRR